MDAASNQLLLAARAEGQRAETDFRCAAPAAAPRHDGRRRGMPPSRLKPAPTISRLSSKRLAILELQHDELRSLALEVLRKMDVPVTAPERASRD